MTHDVFISYSRADKDITDLVCRALEENGISYWIDKKMIAGGQNFANEIVPAIKSSRVTVFISSENSNNSLYTVKEITIAYKNNKHIIPFRVQNISFADQLEFYLCDLSWIDAFENLENKIDELVCSILKLTDSKREHKRFKIEKLPILDEPLEQLSKSIDMGSIELPEPKGAEVDINAIADCEIERFIGGGKIGYRHKGHAIIEPQFSINAGSFSEGLAAVEQSGRYGFIDKSGSIVIPLTYDYVGSFCDELAPVTLNGKSGYIDRYGRVAIPLIYDEALPFGDALACVKMNSRYGFIDKLGRTVISHMYDGRSSKFSGGLACMLLRDRGWGVINRSGRVIIPFKYTAPFSFNDGLANVCFNNRVGYIDNYGNVAIHFKYDMSSYGFKEGLACVSVNGRYGFIDREGRAVIPIQYDWAGSFSEGFACVSLRGKYGYIDRVGQVVIPIQYDGATPSFHDGLACVKSGDKWGWIDRSDRVVIPYKYESQNIFINGLAWVRLNGRRGRVDIEGNECWGD